jgi:hypothetical protein
MQTPANSGLESSIDWKQNPTKFKLREAKYFLDKAKEAYSIYIGNNTAENRDVLLFTLDAFFSAARSITFYMQKQYDSKSGFSVWYFGKQTDMKSDDELEFLKELRNCVTHITTPTISTIRETSSKFTGYAVYADDRPLKETEPQVSDTKPFGPLGTQIKTLDVIFDPDVYPANRGLKINTEVLPFCCRQLQKFEKLLDECERHFK